MVQPPNVHGTGLLLGSTGLLLRGPSGAGKSVLALALLDRWEARGEAACLVADDRIELMQMGQQLHMHAPPRLAGLIELRGRGIVSRPHHTPVRLDLVIDLVPETARMLEEDAMRTDLAGVALARAPVPQAGLIGLGHQVLLVLEAIRALSPPLAQP